MPPLRKFLAHMAGGLGVIGIAFFFLVFSCSQKLPTAPVAPVQVSSPTDAPPPAGSTPGLNLIGGNLLGGLLGLVKKVIGVLGGILSIPVENTPYKSLLVIPKGALTQNVTISAGGRFDKMENATFYDFSPDGLNFLKPASLLHRAREANGSVLNLWYFNPQTKCWEKAGSATVISGTATFSVLHFSKWAVSPEWDGLGSGGQP